jgi:hypothetical protein
MAYKIIEVMFFVCMLVSSFVPSTPQHLQLFLRGEEIVKSKERGIVGRPNSFNLVLLRGCD